MKQYITEDSPEALKARIAKALEQAVNGQCDGSHHKAWAIDQMVGALLGCEDVIYESHSGLQLNGRCPSVEYVMFVEDFEQEDPETGEKWGEWDYGIE